MKNYYEILGVSTSASGEEIKKAYRRLAHKHHPDKQGGDENRFKEINEAYYVLGDDKRKREFDHYGRVFSGVGPASPEGGAGFDFEDIWRNFSDARGSSGGGDFSDVFGDIFGFSSTSSSRARRGSDISIDLEIPFSEAIFGTTRNVLLRKTGVCDSCGGSGARTESKKIRCMVCSGSGTVRESRKSFFGTFIHLSECSRCRGAGETIQDPCLKCRGDGVLKKGETVEVQIPSGIRDSEMIRMVEAGEARAHGVAGDLYVKIHVLPHPQFEREDSNIITTLEIPLSAALLGVDRVLDTIDGTVKIKIPAGVDFGEILRVKSRGVPRASGGRGDLLIKVLIRNPKKLSKKAKALIEELKKEGV
ncbi:DnaJ domain-containing protein [Patescibacteria group bacterium]|nr:DnaJ domain-containing protein [Patescibacteria group bacterium]